MKSEMPEIVNLGNYRFMLTNGVVVNIAPPLPKWMTTLFWGSIGALIIAII